MERQVSLAGVFVRELFLELRYRHLMNAVVAGLRSLFLHGVLLKGLHHG
jgi:hypothetical protein